jgi:molecular chaperone GrpE
MEHQHHENKEAKEAMKECCGQGCCDHEKNMEAMQDSCCQDNPAQQGCCGNGSCGNACACEASEEDVLKQEILDLTDMLQRMQAEFDNYRKRTMNESAQYRLVANELLVRSLLPVVDNFELALASHKEKSEFHKGMELIYAQLHDILESQGLKRIDSVGQRFNPHEHEALLTEETSGESNMVLEELQKGYTFHGKVLRHTKVKISKKKQ